MKNYSKRLFICFIVMFLFIFCTKNIYSASVDLLNKKYKSINVYEKFDIKTIQKNSSIKYNYSSSDNNIASINENGIIIGSSIGETVITISDQYGNVSKLYLNVGFYKGIDISTFNGNVNFQLIKDQGIDFVMIRSSYGWYDQYDAAAGKTYGFQYDEKLYNNVKGASETGIPFGIYHYSYARNTYEASLEAEYTINAIRSTGGYINNISLPVAYDVEDSKYQGGIDKNTLTDIVITYCTKIKEAGFIPMIYANKTWFMEHLDINRINSLGYNFWYALWPNNVEFSTKVQIGDSGIYPLIWQYTSSGSVDGANTSSGTVDMNVMYMKDQVNLTFFIDGQVIEEKGIDKGATSTFPNFEKAGYTLVNWRDENNNIVNSNTMFNQNTKIHANYKRVELNLNAIKFSLKKGSTQILEVEDENKNYISSEKLNFISLDENIVSVDNEGKIKGISDGTTMIKVSLKENEEIYNYCNVTVGDQYLNGDINRDGKINVDDLSYGLRGLTRKIILTDEEKQIGDVTGDGLFNVDDLNKMLRYFVRKIPSL